MNIHHSTRERELAAKADAANRGSAGVRFAKVSLPFGLFGGSALLALIIGVGLSPLALQSLFQEGGWVENATVVLYAFAMIAIWFTGSPHFGRSSAAAATVVLAVCVAREISLRRWIISAGDGSYCCAHEVSAVLAVIVLVALAVSTVVLCRRHAAQVWRSLIRKEPVAATLFALFCTAALSQLFDRLPALLALSLPTRSALLALSFEETLELLMPVLVIVAALQARARNETKPRASAR